MRKSRSSQKLGIRYFLRYLANILDTFLDHLPGVEKARPIYVLFSLSILGIMMLILLGILALVYKNITTGIFDISLAFILIGNLLHGLRYRHYTFNTYLGISFVALLFVYMFLTGGVNRSGGFIWYYAFPLIACYILGSKRGAAATILILLPVIGLFLVKNPPSFFVIYDFYFKIRFISSFLLVFAFSFLFEYSREKNHEKLQRAHDDLEKRVEGRTSALQEAIQSLQKEISERRRIEEALRESEEKYRTILENIEDGYYEVDFAGNLTFFNDSICQISGRTKEELMGMNDREYTDQENAKKLYQTFYQVYRTGEPRRELDWEVIRKDGTKRCMEASVSLRKDPSGKPIGFRGIARDITERKRAEEALRESEEKYRTILENIEDGYYEVDLLGNLTFFNDSMCRIWGYPREELMGMNDRQYTDKENAKKLFQAFNKVYRTGEPRRECDWEIIRKDGTKRCIEASVSLRKDPSGKPIGFRGIIRDITERKRAEEALKEKTEELARSNQDLEQFAYVASHDLQEPLRMVTSYVQLLSQRYRDKLDSDAGEFIGFAVDGATRMWKLINDLLTYSRVGTRGKELESTDCEAVLNQSLNNLKVAIEEKGAVVTHDPLPKVMADNLQMGQLFQNLIGNAIKFRGNEPPRIHVSASRKGNVWTFSVRDNGIGIAPEYAERIFIIFQRLHGRNEYDGTGIGLAICKRIVERHGGRIWAESEVGKGATFYFTLPAIKANPLSS
jgi:PAS domain S-box-containing protein